MEQKSLDIQESVRDLTQQLQNHPDKYECPTRHTFADGMYCREMFAHAGTMMIGATHKKECFNMLTEGEIIISNGEKEVYLKAPQTFVGGIGVQKLGYAITDVVWVNVFRTDAKSVEEAEQELFVEEIYKENI